MIKTSSMDGEVEAKKKEIIKKTNPQKNRIKMIRQKNRK